MVQNVIQITQKPKIKIVCLTEKKKKKKRKKKKKKKEITQSDIFRIYIHYRKKVLRLRITFRITW